MSVQPKADFVTPEEYLARERTAETKSEYFGGEVVAMAGASPDNNRIAADVTIALGNRLGPSGCEVFTADLRVRVSPSGPFTYPDVVIACDRPEFDRDDCLKNPRVIVEVLSPSTEYYDRGEKFVNYRRMASLQEYVLIAQDRIRVEHYTRQEGGLWLLEELNQPEHLLVLPSVGCEVPLSEIYRRASFTSETSPDSLP